MTEAQEQFDGFAIVDLYGHQRFAGYLKSVYFGDACMFRLDVPPLEARERITKGGCYVDEFDPESGERVSQQWVPPGSKVAEAATIGYTKLWGIKSVYGITPCDEKACLAAVAELQPRPLMLVSLPQNNAKTQALAAVAECPDPAGVLDAIVRDYDCCTGDPESGHSPDCPNYWDQEGDGDENESR